MLCLTLCAVVGATTAWWSWQKFNEPAVTEDTLYIVAPGTGLNKLAGDIADELPLKPGSMPEIMMLYGRVIDRDIPLKTGEYQFTAGMSLHDILSKIKRGEIFRRFVTLREGLTSHEIVAALERVDDLEGTIEIQPAEGRLLPETYDYRRGETRAAVLERMEKAMDETLLALWTTHIGGDTTDPGAPGFISAKAKGLPFETPREALILASIIEKETGKPEERRRVAGVFINRLNKGMALQTDPTVIYALTQGKHENEGQGPLGRRLLKKDLEFDSPYNTYLYPGLPPGPIANPGKGSIEAALNPEIHDYYYFVADGTGGHVFGRNLAEHNENAAKWRKIRRAQESAAE